LIGAKANTAVACKNGPTNTAQTGRKFYSARAVSAIKLGKVTKEEVAWELNESGELRAMIVAAIRECPEFRV
jgi:hypothetical protein